MNSPLSFYNLLTLCGFAAGRNVRRPRLTDDCEDLLAECGLEERRLARDLAAEAARRVQVHAPQQDVRLARLPPLK